MSTLRYLNMYIIAFIHFGLPRGSFSACSNEHAEFNVSNEENPIRFDSICLRLRVFLLCNAE